MRSIFNDKKYATKLVLNALLDGGVPWRWPLCRKPEFAKLFGRFYSGMPNFESPDYSRLDSIVSKLGVKIVHHWKRKNPAFYLYQDRIAMPSRSGFLSDAEYHGARTHEVMHYLEQPWRLKWDKTVDKSELMAEIGQCLIESYFRLAPAQDDTNIRKWLLVWDQQMQRSSQYLFDAIEQAESSLKYLIKLQDQLKVG